MLVLVLFWPVLFWRFTIVSSFVLVNYISAKPFLLFHLLYCYCKMRQRWFRVIERRQRGWLENGAVILLMVTILNMFGSFLELGHASFWQRVFVILLKWSNFRLWQIEEAGVVGHFENASLVISWYVWYQISNSHPNRWKVLYINSIKGVGGWANGGIFRLLMLEIGEIYAGSMMVTLPSSTGVECRLSIISSILPSSSKRVLF